MMDAINKAKAALDEAKEYRAVEVAQAYATIAQAEQTKRVADALERWLSVQGVLPEFYEHIDRMRTAGDKHEGMSLNELIWGNYDSADVPPGI